MNRTLFRVRDYGIVEGVSLHYKTGWVGMSPIEVLRET